MDCKFCGRIHPKLKEINMYECKGVDNTEYYALDIERPLGIIPEPWRNKELRVNYCPICGRKLVEQIYLWFKKQQNLDKIRFSLENDYTESIYMNKLLRILTDVFLIAICIYLAIISDNKLNIFINGVSVGVWIYCFIFNILDFWFKYNKSHDKGGEYVNEDRLQ